MVLCRYGSHAQPYTNPTLTLAIAHFFGGVGGDFNPSSVHDAAVNNGLGPHRLIDDRGNVPLMRKGWNATAAAGNKASLNQYRFVLSGGGVVGHGRTSSSSSPRIISIASDAATGGTAWHNATALLAHGREPPPAPPLPVPPPPVPASLLRTGLALRLRAADLVTAGVRPGDKVAAWADSSMKTSSHKLVQPDAAHQPVLRSIVLASSSVPVVQFDGSNLTSLSAPLELGSEQTYVAVTAPTNNAGSCCNALACAYNPDQSAPSTKGVAFVRASDGTLHQILDYDGEENMGFLTLNLTLILTLFLILPLLLSLTLTLMITQLTASYISFYKDQRTNFDDDDDGLLCGCWSCLWGAVVREAK